MLESINFKILCEDTTFHAENIDVHLKKCESMPIDIHIALQ